MHWVTKIGLCLTCEDPWALLPLKAILIVIAMPVMLTKKIILFLKFDDNLKKTLFQIGHESKNGCWIEKMNSAGVGIRTEKRMGGNKNNYINSSLHLARKYARILVRGHIWSEKRTLLPARASIWGADNDEGQINEHIFASNDGYYVHYPSNISQHVQFWKLRNITRMFPSFCWESSEAFRSDQPPMCERIYWMDF